MRRSLCMSLCMPCTPACQASGKVSAGRPMAATQHAQSWAVHAGERMAATNFPRFFVQDRNSSQQPNES